MEGEPVKRFEERNLFLAIMESELGKKLPQKTKEVLHNICMGSTDMGTILRTLKYNFNFESVAEATEIIHFIAILWPERADEIIKPSIEPIIEDSEEFGDFFKLGAILAMFKAANFFSFHYDWMKKSAEKTLTVTRNGIISIIIAKISTWDEKSFAKMHKRDWNFFKSELTREINAYVRFKEPWAIPPEQRSESRQEDIKMILGSVQWGDDARNDLGRLILTGICYAEFGKLDIEEAAKMLAKLK